MALSRIWAAFIIVSILMACFKWMSWGDSDIFNRMVVGKADDTYGYYMTGNEAGAGITLDSFVRKMKDAGYQPKNKIESSNYLISNDLSSDSVRIFKRQTPSLIDLTY